MLIARLILIAFCILILISCERKIQNPPIETPPENWKISVNTNTQFPRKDFGGIPPVWRPFRIDVKGNHVYVLDNTPRESQTDPVVPSNIYIIDISNQKSPIITSKLTLRGRAWDVLSRENYTYIGTSLGLDILNTSDPLHPTQVNNIFDLHDVACVIGKDNFLFTLDSKSSLHVYNLQKPDNPTEVFRCDIGPKSYITQSMFLNRDYLFVPDKSGNTKIFKVSDPTSPVLIATINKSLNADSCHISGNYLYAGSQNEILVYDITDISNPKHVGYVKDHDYPMAITSKNSRLYILSADDHGNITTCDMSNPLSPVKTAKASLTGRIKDVCLDDNYIYTVNESGIFNVYEFPSELIDKEEITPIGAIANPRFIRDFRVRGNYAFALASEGLVAYDISSPENIFCRSLHEFNPATRNLEISNNKIYICADLSPKSEYIWTSHQFRDPNAKIIFAVINIADPGNLIVEASINIPAKTDKFIVLKDKYLLLTTNNTLGLHPEPPNDLYLIDISDLRNPHEIFRKQIEKNIINWNHDDIYLYVLENGTLAIYGTESIESMTPISATRIPDGSSVIDIIDKTAIIASEYSMYDPQTFAKVDISDVQNPLLVSVTTVRLK